MRITGIATALLVILAGPGRAQVTPSPYAGQENREIKALAPEEMAAYLAGDGLGFAKAAELNGYPGPRHVLELASPLGLTLPQREHVRSIFDAMQIEAKRLGAEVVAAERRLDGLFANAEIDEPQLLDAVAGIAVLQGRLRVAHLQAHLRVKRVLTPEQVAHYDRLRGYGDGQPHVHPDP